MYIMIYVLNLFPVLFVALCYYQFFENAPKNRWIEMRLSLVLFFSRDLLEIENNTRLNCQ